MSDSLRPHESQNARPPCPSPTPGVYPNSCPSSQWCHPAISSFVIPSSSCPQSLPASGSFPMSESAHTHKTKISIVIWTIVFCPWCFKSLDSSSVLINWFLQITHHIFKFSMKYSSRIRFFIKRAFIAVFITRAKIWKQPNCPTMDLQRKHGLIYVYVHTNTRHTGILFNYKRELSCYLWLYWWTRRVLCWVT